MPKRLAPLALAAAVIAGTLAPAAPAQASTRTDLRSAVRACLSTLPPSAADSELSSCGYDRAMSGFTRVISRKCSGKSYPVAWNRCTDGILRTAETEAGRQLAAAKAAQGRVEKGHKRAYRSAHRKVVILAGVLSASRYRP